MVFDFPGTFPTGKAALDITSGKMISQGRIRLPARRTSMRRTKDILRLRFELGLGLRQIARSLSISVGTVHDYLQRAEAAGIKWPLPESFDDRLLEAALFRQPTVPVPARKTPPDYGVIHQQLQKPHVTLQLLWEEYQEVNPDGYRYSRFCELYQRWRRKQDVVLRQQHKPGERMFVDWAGATIAIHDRSTGEISQAPLFVATLGASSYTYAEIARNQQLDSWIQVNMHALEFYGGVPQLSVPDFVPGHRIEVLWPSALCGLNRGEPHWSGWMP
jgi:transposase